MNYKHTSTTLSVTVRLSPEYSGKSVFTNKTVLILDFTNNLEWFRVSDCFELNRFYQTLTGPPDAVRFFKPDFSASIDLEA